MNTGNNYKNFIWNLIFSIVQALQTVLLLLVVNRVLGENEAGVFGYAFSVAVLLVFIGNYGIRNFQVSDSKEEYSPYEYYGFRLITCLFMFIMMAILLILSKPSGSKVWAIVFLTIGRFAECIEDVFHGRYQQQGDLYIAGFQGSVRFIISDILFVFALVYCKNLIIACLIYGLSSLLISIIWGLITVRNYGGFSISFNKDSMTGLFLSCFPLFSGYFLSTYLTNAPKYTIESLIRLYPEIYDDRFQAFFNMIFMPVLMINLLSTVVFRPFIVEMAEYYNSGNKKKYNKLVYRQIFVIILIGIIILPICYFIGIPILSCFYNSDLHEYKIEFMILLLGGVFSAFSSFFNVCIITIRKQKALLIGTAILSVLALVLYKLLPFSQGMIGISIVYLIIMFIQALIYFFIHHYYSGKA